MPINIYKTIANGRVYDLSNVSYTEEQDPTYEEAKVELMKKRMHDVVNTLSGRQKQVIILRFGFIGGRMYTQDETGLLVGRHRPVEGKENVVSGESVRSIERFQHLMIVLAYVLKIASLYSLNNFLNLANP